MTGLNVSRRSTTFRKIVSSLAVLGAFVAVNTPATPVFAQTYAPQGYAPQGYTPQAYAPQGYPPQGQYAGGPSGSVSGDVVNFNGRGAGVMLRGGHTTGEGIGRIESASHIGAMPYVTFGNSLLFGDSRFLRTNSGGLAWSFGGGLRHYFSDIDAVFGLNGYFDRDQHAGSHFNQWSVGAELLSHNWEWRGNVYTPFDQTEIQTGLAAVEGSTTFDGDTVLFNQVRSFAAAIEGYDTEIGFLLPGRLAAKHQVRAFAGYYYFEARETEIPGWKVRLQGDPTEWLGLDLQVSDDDQFGTNVTLAAEVSFGGYRENVNPNNSRYRLGETVRRNYTFSTDNVDELESGVTAVDPDTGLPFRITHVNSSAGPVQTGSVTQPFATIDQALASGGDIIFAHAGSIWDAASGGNTATLLPNTRVLGEGTIGSLTTQHFLDVGDAGLVQLGPSPDFLNNPTLARPILTDAGLNGLDLVSNTEFSGFQVLNTGQHGIFGANVSNVTLNQNLIGSTTGDGIFLQNPGGINQIIDTTIQDTAGDAFHIDGGDSITTFAQSTEDSGFSRIENSSGFAVNVENTLVDSIISMAEVRSPTDLTETLFFGSTIDDNGGSGVRISNANGDVLINNLASTASLANAINIDGGSGTFTFSNSGSRTQTDIISPAADAISISGLLDGGRAIFDDPVVITDRTTGGILIQDGGGEVQFRDNVLVTGHTSAAGSAVAILNNLSTSRVAFVENLVIDTANSVGLEIAGNELGSEIDFGSSGLDIVTLTNVDGDNIQIANNSSNLAFSSDLNINGRGANPLIIQPAHGILIDNSTGNISFGGTTTIDNVNDITDSALEITSSAASITFGTLDAMDTQGDAGVLLVDNLSSDLGDADIRFNGLGDTGNNGLVITSDTGGIGFQAINNSSVIVNDGSITSTAAQAVDIDTSGIDVRLSFLASQDSPDFGIRIEDTFRAEQSSQETSRFEVTSNDGIPGPGTAGNVERAAVAGAFLRNPGIVRLNQMSFEDNETGIDVAYSNLTESPSEGERPRIETGELELEDTDFEDNNLRAIDGVNIPELIIANGNYEDNGDDGGNGVTGFETIRLQYDEDPSDNADLDDYDFPYLVDVSETAFSSANILNEFNLFDIQRTDGGGDDAHLDLRFADNTFNDDITRNVLTEDLDGTLFIVWEGPLDAEFTNNTFNLTEDIAFQRGLSIQNLSDDDETFIGTFSGNTWNLSQDADLDNVTFREKIAFEMELDGPAIVNLTSNTVNITEAAELMRGFVFEFNDTADLEMISTTILSAAGEDVNGIEIDFDSGTNQFSLDSTFIGLPSAGSVGLQVNSIGVTNLGPTQGVFNTITGGTPFILTGNFQSFLTINGNQVP